MEAHDIPDRLVPPNWSSAQTVCAAFAAASTTTGLLVTVTTGRPISLGLVLLGLLTFGVMHSGRAMGPYLVLSGAVELQLSLVSGFVTSPRWSHDVLLSPGTAYGVVGTAAVVLGCVYYRIATSRYRRFFSAPGEAADT
ncbi:hypothetical protein CJ179_29355 [Rhodococcus sp. ACS1]|uniref:hypothetical protein n=1 Tax=Rhodococcus sp. ACS1 TaxID=2028570 RepID=UPI000BB0D29F|nr:hypothetical protein [Rhodococcus sp. ACS1]PBC44881.1 hypothetical protein CJ179_29355 [Rhodococcus sp. ACS1]